MTFLSIQFLLFPLAVISCLKVFSIARILTSYLSCSYFTSVILLYTIFNLMPYLYFTLYIPLVALDR